MNLYKKVHVYNSEVHVYTDQGRELPVKNQRGRLFVYYNGRQINLKQIPTIQESIDPVFDYIFNGGFMIYRCYAMDYWIYRYRLKNKITPTQYKLKFKIKNRRTP